MNDQSTKPAKFTTENVFCVRDGEVLVVKMEIFNYFPGNYLMYLYTVPTGTGTGNVLTVPGFQ